MEVIVVGPVGSLFVKVTSLSVEVTTVGLIVSVVGLLLKLTSNVATPNIPV